MKYRYFFLVLAPGLLFSAISCGMLASVFSEEEAVTVLLPALPPAAERAGITDPVWTLRWHPAGSAGKEQHVQGRTGVLVLEKGVFTPILAELAHTDPRHGPYPVAGSVYPPLARSSPEAAEIHADWAGGTAAIAATQALLSANDGAETAGNILSRFNWNRLVQEIATMENPEYIDYTRLVPAMLSGEFRVYDIKPRPLHSYRITLKNRIPEAGEEFISAWPGKTAFIWPGPEGISVEIPEGMSRFYGTNGCITIQTGSSSGNGVFFMPYSLQEADSSGTVKRYENDHHGNSLHHAPGLVQSAFASPGTH